MVLQGDRVDPGELEKFIESATSEGTTYDFKAGQWLSKPNKERNGKLRKYAAAFGNSDGGTLIIGVDEVSAGKWLPSGNISAKFLGIEADAWLRDVLVDFAGTGLRFNTQCVKINSAEILTVAFSRALRHLWTNGDRRERSYFVRIGDSVQVLEGGVLHELLTGERQVPELRLSASVAPQTVTSDGARIDVTVENTGAVAVRGLRVMCVVRGPQDKTPTNLWRPVSGRLGEYFCGPNGLVVQSRWIGRRDHVLGILEQGLANFGGVRAARSCDIEREFDAVLIAIPLEGLPQFWRVSGEVIGDEGRPVDLRVMPIALGPFRVPAGHRTNEGTE